MGLLDTLAGRPPSVSHEAARAHAEAGGVVVYWRPGCAFCLRLAGRLRRVSARAAWVDIWRDDDARAYVRSVNDGNETVPTVVIDGTPHTNPDPAVVRRALTASS